MLALVRRRCRRAGAGWRRCHRITTTCACWYRDSGTARARYGRRHRGTRCAIDTCWRRYRRTSAGWRRCG